MAEDIFCIWMWEKFVKEQFKISSIRFNWLNRRSFSRWVSKNVHLSDEQNSTVKINEEMIENIIKVVFNRLGESIDQTKDPTD